jgi:LCP family protein required for cell wall assembly
MRTTLKRGIGRAATGAANGNGRAIYPPAARAPMRRYRVPPPPVRTGWQTVGWLFKWFGIALVIVIVGLAGGAYLYGHQTLTAFQPHHTATKRATKQLEKIESASQPATAIMIGYDKRAGADGAFDTGSRSDTIMLVRADPQRHSVSLLSFPRDLVVPIYCGSGPTGSVDRINSAWSRCGPTGTVATVAALTGIRPNYLITVDFHGFKLLVNKLHGVYIDVDHRYLNTQGGPYGYAKIDLEPGYQKLNGQQALDFVRFRHTDSDIYRLARQQLFITALRERIAAESKKVTTVFKIIGALKGNVEIGQAGGGAVPPDTALSYLQFAHGLPSRNFFRVQIDGLSGSNELSAPQSSIDEAVQKFLNPDVNAAEKAQAAATGSKPKLKRPPLKPREVSVLVLNGTTITGFAANTSYELAKLGYRTVSLLNGQAPNAPSQTYYQTQVYFNPQQAKGRTAAKVLQKLFPGSIVGPIPPEIASYEQAAGGPLAVVVLGSSFDGRLRASTPPPDTTPKHEPPNVTTAPWVTQSQLRAAQRQIHRFRLMVPHVIERSSRLALLSPVRLYKPASKHVAARLTFVTGPGNVYWGIEQTDWDDAPVLRHPSLTRRFGGRRFDFYYSGGHLHMVVLRTPKASYWVVNTLRDELSNETMIAIARGLRPLGH